MLSWSGKRWLLFRNISESTYRLQISLSILLCWFLHELSSLEKLSYLRRKLLVRSAALNKLLFPSSNFEKVSSWIRSITEKVSWVCVSSRRTSCWLTVEFWQKWYFERDQFLINYPENQHRIKNQWSYSDSTPSRRQYWVIYSLQASILATIELIRSWAKIFLRAIYSGMCEIKFVIASHGFFNASTFSYSALFSVSGTGYN